MREVQNVSEIDPFTTVVDISIEVNPVNDDPHSYVTLNGEVVGNERDATVSILFFPYL